MPMTKPTFYSINEDGYYDTTSSLLARYGFQSVPIDDADILVFNGGADIATSIYNEGPVFAGIPRNLSFRDKVEVELFEEFVNKKFMFGICRGAQLLNCLNGGSLWQHVTNHQRDHKMIDLRTGEIIQVTSTHHQMMRPSNSAEIIGVANECTYRMCASMDEVVEPSDDIREGKDVEVVWYPAGKSLCIQGHPEYVPGSRFATWSINLLLEKMGLQSLTEAA
jgi:putative glutamine amidotransferase